MDSNKELEYKRTIATVIDDLRHVDYSLAMLIRVVSNIKNGEIITKHHLTELKKYTKRLSSDTRINRSCIRLNVLLKL